jgi:hypothetical protein
MEPPGGDLPGAAVSGDMGKEKRANETVLFYSEELAAILGADVEEEGISPIAERECDWMYGNDITSGDDGHSGVRAGIDMFAAATARGHRIFYCDVEDFRYYFIAESEADLLSRAAGWV